MIRNSRRPATLRRLSLAIIVLAWIGISPVAAQDTADEFQILSSDVANGGSVAVLVTGWHPVTGEELDIQLQSDGRGMVAITGDEFVEAVSSTGRVSEVRRYEYLPVIAMTMDADALAAAKSYESGVQVWKDQLMETQLLESGWMVGANRAHKSGYTGKGTWIAVLDTGVDIAHPFIAGRRIIEACFAQRCPNNKKRMLGDGAAHPIGYHGTHVAGIALGNGKGMSGVAPEAGLIAINVFDKYTDKKGKEKLVSHTSSQLAALDWLIRLAWTQPVSIASINMSLGGGSYAGTQRCLGVPYDPAVILLASLDVMIVAASGNNGQPNNMSRPACVNGIVSVGSIDKKFRVANSSNSGRILDILAPGVAINSAIPRYDGYTEPYAKLSGTSMAAPQVAGAFAVLRQAAPHSSVQDLYRALIDSGKEIRDGRNGITKRSLDVAGALRALGVQPGADATSPDDGGAAQEEESGWQPIGE